MGFFLPKRFLGTYLRPKPGMPCCFSHWGLLRAGTQITLVSVPSEDCIIISQCFLPPSHMHGLSGTPRLLLQTSAAFFPPLKTTGMDPEVGGVFLNMCWDNYRTVPGFLKQRSIPRESTYEINAFWSTAVDKPKFKAIVQPKVLFLQITLWVLLKALL